MDKGAVGYLAASALMCIGICMYCAGQTRPLAMIPAAESTEVTTVQTQAASGADNEKLKTMPVYAQYAFLDDFNIPHIIVKNNTEQIYGYSLSVKYYDESNTLIEQKTIDIHSVIPSGMAESPEKFIPPTDGTKYISAAVTAYSVKDKTVKQPAVYNDMHYTLKQLKGEKTDAPCTLIVTGSPEIISSRGKSDLSDIRFEVTNLSERKIKNIEFLAAEYDANGKPVSAKPNGYIKENIRKLTWSNAWLEKDIPKTAASAMSLNKNCSQVRIIVSHIDFDDRGVWSNPQALDWILSQE